MHFDLFNGSALNLFKTSAVLPYLADLTFSAGMNFDLFNLYAL